MTYYQLGPAPSTAAAPWSEPRDHGVALLAALGLPQLVRHDIVTDDPAAIGDALDVVIAHLDALDAPAEDLEDDGTAEEEPDDEDGGDAELSLGWCRWLFTQSRLGDPSDDLELTALERNGHGFIRTGADDAEQDDPAEDDDGAGDEDSGIGDEDGLAEQLAGWDRCPRLNYSAGGYVG